MTRLEEIRHLFREYGISMGATGSTVRDLLEEIDRLNAKAPQPKKEAATFNHTREDSPLTPCKLCASLVDDPEFLRAALEEMRSRLLPLRDENARLKRYLHVRAPSLVELETGIDALRRQLTAAHERVRSVESDLQEERSRNTRQATTIRELRARAEKAEDALCVRPAPIPMRLPCPQCGTLHVDEGDFAPGPNGEPAKTPHHTHECQACGLTWRPAKEQTIGVRFLFSTEKNAAPKEPPGETPAERTVRVLGLGVKCGLFPDSDPTGIYWEACTLPGNHQQPLCNNRYKSDPAPEDLELDVCICGIRRCNHGGVLSHLFQLRP